MKCLHKTFRTTIASFLLVCTFLTLFPTFHARADASWKGGNTPLSEADVNNALTFANAISNPGDYSNKYYKKGKDVQITKTTYSPGGGKTYCDEFVIDCYIYGAGLQDRTAQQINSSLKSLSKELKFGTVNISKAAMDARVSSLLTYGMHCARDRALLAYLYGELHVGDTNPPVGALVFWEWVNPDSEGHNYGHAGICIGNNKVINVRSPQNGLLTVNSISEITGWGTHGGYHYLGWAAPAGYSLPNVSTSTNSGNVTTGNNDKQTSSSESKTTTNGNSSSKDTTTAKQTAYVKDECVSLGKTCVVIKVTKDSAPVWSLPCSNKTRTDSVKLTTLKKGTFLNASEVLRNSANNLWYKVEVDGRTCYIYGENTTAVGISDDVLVSGSTIKLATRTITKGSSCRISGTYKTENVKIISVTGVLDSTKFTNSKDKQTVTVKVNGNKLDFQPSDINKNLKFGKLPVGKGSLSITAVFEALYIDGKVAKTKQFPPMQLHTLEFNIVAKK